MDSKVLKMTLRTGFALTLLVLLVRCSLQNRYGIIPYTPAETDGGSRQIDTLDTDYAVYTFKQVATGNLMEVSGNIYYNEKYKDGQTIRQHTLSRTGGEIDSWQQWYVIYKNTKDGTKYYTIRNVFSGELLSAPSGAVASAPIQQSRVQPAPADSQLWSFHHIGNTKLFNIISKSSGLAVTSLPGGSQDSVPVLLAPEDGSDAQRWVLDQQPVVSYRDDEVVRFFERNKSSQGSVAFDQGNSIPLQWGANKGKVLWITQDAWDGSELKANGQFSCSEFFRYRNSVMIQPSTTDWNPDHTPNLIRTGSLQNRPKQIFDVVPNTEYAWPAAGIEIGNKVYIQCGEGSGLGPNLSQSLYELTENENLLWTVKRLTPAGMTDESEINYSAGMVKAADGFVYVFGHHGTGFGYTLDLYVARFPVTDPVKWTFWNGSNWADKPVTGTVARITDGLGTASVAYVDGKYVFMSMDQGFNCDSARNIYMATSKNPTGPFTPLKKVYRINEYLYGSYARYYTPVIHPVFNNGRKELLVTYCLNFSACGVTDCKDGYLDPYFYRVKGVRVPYELIGL